jgi:hypothetical protein
VSKLQVQELGFWEIKHGRLETKASRRIMLHLGPDWHLGSWKHLRNGLGESKQNNSRDGPTSHGDIFIKQQPVSDNLFRSCIHLLGLISLFCLLTACWVVTALGFVQNPKSFVNADTHSVVDFFVWSPYIMFWFTFFTLVGVALAGNETYTWTTLKPKPTEKPHNLCGRFGYGGCYESGSGFPSFNLAASSQDMTLEMCAASCSTELFGVYNK